MKLVAGGEHSAHVEAEPQPKKRTPPAMREHYFALLEKVLGPLPRDVFTGECMVQGSDGFWEPAENLLEVVKSEAHQLSLLKRNAYDLSAVKPHFRAYQAGKPPKLIPEIPKWDGTDRIHMVAECLLLDGTQDGFTPELVDGFLRHWLTGVFRKLEDPGWQNPVLIFKGDQGLGKDYLINVLTGGFEQWASNLTLTQNDRDNYLQLSHSAVLRIGEFERTAKADLAMLKEMIFRETSYLRESHCPKFKHMRCRASFVANTNRDDIYRDETGNRRFIVFNLAGIVRAYPATSADSKQILAQARELDKAGWQLDPEHQRIMAAFLRERTPEPEELQVADTFDRVVERLICQGTLATTIRERRKVSNGELFESGALKLTCKECEMKPRELRRLLKLAGREWRSGAERGFKIVPVINTEDRSVIEVSSKCHIQDEFDV